MYTNDYFNYVNTTYSECSAPKQKKDKLKFKILQVWNIHNGIIETDTFYNFGDNYNILTIQRKDDPYVIFTIGDTVSNYKDREETYKIKKIIKGDDYRFYFIPVNSSTPIKFTKKIFKV